MENVKGQMNVRRYFMQPETDAANELDELYERLSKAWSFDSCSPSLRASRSDKNPSVGQCFVSALAVQDELGGDIYELHFADGSVHYFNRINGMTIDMTSEQFGGTVKPGIYDAGIRTDRYEHLYDPVKSGRYAALKIALQAEEERKP